MSIIITQQQRKCESPRNVAPNKVERSTSIEFSWIESRNSRLMLFFWGRGELRVGWPGKGDERNPICAGHFPQQLPTPSGRALALRERWTGCLFWRKHGRIRWKGNGELFQFELEWYSANSAADGYLCESAFVCWARWRLIRCGRQGTFLEKKSCGNWDEIGRKAKETKLTNRRKVFSYPTAMTRIVRYE